MPLISTAVKISRCFHILALLLPLLLASGVARAQTAATATTAATTTPPAASSELSAADLQSLVNTIQDPVARDRLVKELQGLIAAKRGQDENSPTAGARSFFAGLSEEANALSDEVIAAAGVLVDAPRLLHWFEDQGSNPELRQRWIDILSKIAIIFGLAILADLVSWFLLRAPTRRINNRAGENLPQRLIFMVLGIVLEAIPIIVFVGVALFVLPLTGPRYGTEHVAQTVIVAYLWSRGICAVSRVLLLSASALALYPLSEETRNYLYIWVRRFTNLAVYGFAIAACTWWLGAPGAIYAMLLRIVVLVLGIFAVIFVMQNRGMVAEWLRGEPDAARSRGWTMLRHRLAESWHILAIVYILGVFGIFMLHVEGGFVFLLRATVLSVVIVLAAALAAQFVSQISERGFAVKPDLKSRFPTLENRTNRYIPALTKLVSTAIYVIAALALLQAWGVNSFLWVEATANSRAAGAIIGIVLSLVAALVAWEIFVSMLERYEQRFASDSRRRARARTMFPFLKLVVIVILAIILVFVVLGQVGINVGALIAGAGVFGIIAGLGSQSIIKDIMTSIAVLIDDTFAVGDVIDVGGGTWGTVEAIALRTIKMRDIRGAILTVPFSEVKVIRNLTKDVSYYVAEVSLSYHEDVDAASAILKQVVEDMRQDSTWRSFILTPLEIVGVDRFEVGAFILRSRFRTLNGKQWQVGREFNLRVKRAFDASGIRMRSDLLPPPQKD